MKLVAHHVSAVKTCCELLQMDQVHHEGPDTFMICFAMFPSTMKTLQHAG